MAEATLNVKERLYQLVHHLRVDQAHFAGWLPRDWSGLVAKYPQVISSLTLVNTFDRRLVEPVSAKLLVVTGDRGPAAETVRNAMRGVPNVQHVELSDYNMLGWSGCCGRADPRVCRCDAGVPFALCGAQRCDRRRILFHDS
jgi:hypothetical protein